MKDSFAIGARALGLAAAILAADPARAQPAQAELVIGVREDSAPFAHLEAGAVGAGGPLRSLGYRGYVVDVCDAVLGELGRRHEGLSMRVRPVTARDRFELLGSGEIDVLCDPATGTPERLEAHQASLPLFVSGIAFAVQPRFPLESYCGRIVGVVVQTTAEARGLAEVLAAGDFSPRFTPRLRAALAGAPEPGEPGCETPEPAVRIGATHAEVAAAFCAGEILYYLGDVEIIRRQLQAIEGCGFRLSERTYTDERYVIFTTRSVADDKVAMLLDIHGILAARVLRPDSLLLHAYEASFETYTPSRKLLALYWSLFGGVPGP